MQKIFGEFIGGRVGIGLLVVRLVAGLALAQHGLLLFQKSGGPFHWMGANAHIPPVLQFLAAFSQLAGGLAIVFGLLTPLALVAVGATMAVAIVRGHAGQPWVSIDPGKHPFEMALGYLSLAVALLCTGPGTYSFDALLWNRPKRVAPDRLERASGADRF
jgi:putative oxidoreductase